MHKDWLVAYSLGSIELEGGQGLSEHIQLVKKTYLTKELA